jgi:hypothetical protein
MSRLASPPATGMRPRRPTGQNLLHIHDRAWHGLQGHRVATEAGVIADSAAHFRRCPPQRARIQRRPGLGGPGRRGAGAPGPAVEGTRSKRARSVVADRCRAAPPAPALHHLSFPEIAEDMFLSPHTVKSQAKSLYRKLAPLPVARRSPRPASWDSWRADHPSFTRSRGWNSPRHEVEWWSAGGDVWAGR